MADLEDYRAKRHKGKTPEPLEGKKQQRSSRAPVFVVQRHSARALHYDFRLERDGVLLSWALPRGVPLRAGERSLAVHVEDHPLDYADFEGEIPAGEYGGGSVEVWDRGTYELERERPDGTLTVILHGKKLKGEWALVPARLGGEQRNWLIVRPAKEAAAGPMQSYKPMWPREAQRVPSGTGWAFELAWLGVRALAPVEGARGHFQHDGGDAIDARAKQVLARMPRALRTSECVLDGVICALDDEGQPSRKLLESGGGTVVYVVFDVLEYETEPILEEPWKERRKRLEAMLDDSIAELRLSRAYDDGAALRRAARARGLGIVAKRVKSAYGPGEVSDDWRVLRP
ncbi:MAG TPA: DNA polymerase ligase N-terminal domain-containing protein [Gaiellales bacterium]|nr:DNA polymerase ligase N-terminal domain-containing protein [Gaiellales bacterium]